MANLRLAMDAAFWDLGLSSPLTLDTTAKAVPGETAPLDGARASKALRPQQLALLRNGFPLGIIPSFSPPSKPDLGSFSLQTLIPGPSAPDWWTGFIAQFRPKKLISSIKSEIMAADELDFAAAKDVAKHILDKSLYALGFFSQFPLTPDTSLMLHLEGHGERGERRAKATVVHSLPEHEVTLEAALPELYLDRNGTYWNVPLSLSLDMASVVSRSGLRYRFGLHKNDGQPHTINSSTTEVPSALLPGLCVKAAFSYEKSRDFWREKDEVSSGKEDTPAWLSSYDERLKEPHSAISAIVGGHCAAWLRGNENLRTGSTAVLSSERTQSDACNFSSSIKKRNPFSADLFGSLCLTFQHGKFKEDFNDLTRLDARIDIPSAASFIKGASYLISDMLHSQSKQKLNPLSSPRFNLILQQQVAGPIIFRVDSRLSFTQSGGPVPHVEDILYGLSYSLRLLESGKVLAWYSPKRREAMVELRLFEF